MSFAPYLYLFGCKYNNFVVNCTFLGIIYSKHNNIIPYWWYSRHIYLRKIELFALQNKKWQVLFVLLSVCTIFVQFLKE
jgi:hypothetical protein